MKWSEEEFFVYCTGEGTIFMEKSDRWNEGKTEWSLIDFPSIECLAKVLMFGKSKYAQDN